MNRRTWLYLIVAVIIMVHVPTVFLTGCKKENKTTNPADSLLRFPSVVTGSVSSISVTTATSGGNVISEGESSVTARGVCWGTDQVPVITNSITTDGSGTGIFSSNLTGLYQGTTYYVRAYATNSAGTGYGAAQTFTTGYASADSGFFPIAVWLQDPKNASAYKDNGINIFVGLWNGLDQESLDLLKTAGMKVICAQNNFGLTVLNEPTIYGWMDDEDEPDNAQWNATTQTYDPCIDPVNIIHEYHAIKHNDPSRQVLLNLGQGVAYNNYIGRGACSGNLDSYRISSNGYLVGCDIASFDIYPVNNSDGQTNNNLWYVAIGVQNLISWSGNKPSWCWIESTKISDTSPQKPTTSEVKSEVWMGLIHGAKGFGYFCHSFVTSSTDEAALLHDPVMISAVKAINAQITFLASVLNSPNTTGYATVSVNNTMVPVDFMTKNYGAANYIFAIAMRNGQTSATFSVTSGNSVEVLGEGRSISISNGKFSDDFSPYSVHLYKITN
jgi:hypothetical protein